MLYFIESPFKYPKSFLFTYFPSHQSRVNRDTETFLLCPNAIVSTKREPQKRFCNGKKLTASPRAKHNKRKKSR